MSDRHYKSNRLREKIRKAYQAGQMSSALRHCRKYLALVPNDTKILPLAGVIAMQLGQNDDAMRFFRAQNEALDGSDGAERSRAYYALCMAFEELGYLTEATSVLERALHLEPDNLEFLSKQASFLEMRGDLERARTVCETVLAAAPDHGAALATFGVILQKQNDHASAVKAYKKALSTAPEMDHVYNNLAMALLHTDGAGELIDFCREWLERVPGNVEAISFLGLALNEAGRIDEAVSFFDFDRFVRVYDIETPEGYDSLEAFNDALEAHVMAHPTLAVPPEDQPTYHHPDLHITEELLAGKMGPMASLQQCMNDNAKQYMRDVSEGPAHPLLAAPPSRWQLTSWAAVLDTQGNLEPHIHLDGYLSGVYYARIPQEVTNAEDPGNGEYAGSIEMGRPPEELNCQAAPLTRLFRPQEGKMLLFPASFYHRTIPFKASSRRISIAFDVVPR
jgi:uncharacterized protein (TIGR02466 family)